MLSKEKTRKDQLEARLKVEMTVQFMQRIRSMRNWDRIIKHKDSAMVWKSQTYWTIYHNYRNQY